LNKDEYEFYDCYSVTTNNECILTNKGIYYDVIDYNVIKDITCLRCSSSTEYFQSHLSNKMFNELLYLRIDKHINLEIVDFNMFPKLEMLIVNIREIHKENLKNMSPSLRTILVLDLEQTFAIDHYCRNRVFNGFKFNNFSFDNLSPNLTKIIINKNEIMGKKLSKKFRKICFDSIKKHKIPHGCEIYFTTGDLDKYISRYFQ
jgi:hypothetical protein